MVEDDRDEGAARENLSAALSALGVVGHSGVRLLAENFRKSVWRVDTPDGPCVVRLLAPSEAHAAAREREVLSIARLGGVPAPVVRAHAMVDGRPALLLSWSSGRTVAAAARARPWAVRRLGVLMGEQQAQLHRLRATLSGDVAWYDSFGSADTAMRRRLEAVQTAEPRLLHLDYHADNVIVDNGSVTGILDWENAAAGDPRADVARTWSLLQLRPREPQHAGALARAFRPLLTAGWWRGYTRSAGPVADMDLFRAWAACGLLRNMRRRYSGATGWMVEQGLPALEVAVAKLRATAQLPPGDFT